MLQIALVPCVIGVIATSSFAQCDFGFVTQSNFSLHQSVTTLTPFDDGRGNAIFVGGTYGGGLSQPQLYRWDGKNWSTVPGTGFVVIPTMITADLGDGIALYVAGDVNYSQQHIGKWNGVEWQQLGNGLPHVPNALLAHDDADGAGLSLFAAYDGGVSKWNAGTWTQIAKADGNICAFAEHDDGNGLGKALYFAGSFTQVNGIACANIARWNGTAVSPLSTGIGGDPSSSVYALLEKRNPEAGLYVAGKFTQAGNQPAFNIARWDGNAWHALPGNRSLDLEITRLYEWKHDQRTTLLAAGKLPSFNSIASRIMQWHGYSWSAFNSDLNSYSGEATIRDMVAFDDGSGHGEMLWVGGQIDSVGPDNGVGRVPRWDGSHWWPTVGSGNALNSQPSDLATFNDGSRSGECLYVGGQFTAAGDQLIEHIARWNGLNWSDLDLGVNGNVETVRAITGIDGESTSLYIGGQFTTAGRNSRHADHIARWNGTSWSALGSGLQGDESFSVRDMIAFDDRSGRGRELYVAGQFSIAGGMNVHNIARWNGTSWSDVGGGLTGGINSQFGAIVEALEDYDDGSSAGPMLYAAGRFESAGGLTIHKIARWDGKSWSDVGGGTPGQSSYITDLVVFDDRAGDGPALYATGYFYGIGSSDARSFARWNGLQWNPVGPVNLHDDLHGDSMTIFDDGTGPALYIAGYRILGSRIARWNGQNLAAHPADFDARRMVTSHVGQKPALSLLTNGLTQWQSGSSDEPLHVQVPPNQIVVTHQSTELSASVNSGGVFTMQWRRNGIPLQDGASFFGVHSLHLFVYANEESASFDVVVSNACETKISNAIILTVVSPTCVEDVYPLPAGDHFVNVDDLLLVIQSWGCNYCHADCSGDGVVNSLDLALVLAHWGACP